jgi:phosphohistidine phosphatase
MNKTLYIVRHAKSSWEDPFLSDHERPLAPKGVRKTKKIAGFLKNSISRPELFLSSTAVRARQTAGILAKELGYPEEKIKYTANLYHAGEDAIFNELYALPDDIHSVMIFGHNPGFTYFVNLFLNPTIDNLPTSGTVSVSFSTNKWNEINTAKFHVNFVVFPKMLK